MSGFEQLFGHRHVFCGLDATGAATCWDFETEDVEYDEYLNPPADLFVTIGVGLYQVCGVSTAGEPLCWGDVPTAFPY